MKLIKLNKILLLFLIGLSSYCYSAETVEEVYDARKAYKEYLKKYYDAIYSGIPSFSADLSGMVRDYSVISFEEFQKNSEQLIQAVKESDLKTVQDLLNKGVDVNFPSSTMGNQPLVIALKISKDKKNTINGILSYVGIDNDADKIINLLLNYPTIDINAKRKKSGWPILMIAVNDGNLRVIERLLNDPRLNNVNEEDSRGDNALTWAVHRRLDKVVELLLKHPDIDPNAIGRNGTALIDAAGNGYITIVRLLLMHHKTDVNIQHNGLTARSWADIRADKSTVEAIDGAECSVQ